MRRETKERQGWAAGRSQQGSVANCSGNHQATGGTVVFDKPFFERALLEIVRQYCSQHACNLPSVHLLLGDGSRLKLARPVALADTWGIFEVYEGPDLAETIVPYPLITRINIYLVDPDATHHMGFTGHQEVHAEVAATRKDSDPPPTGP